MQSKLPDVGTTIFAVMSQMANEHGAINLSQGFPDFNCPQELIDRVEAAMRRGQNQYAPMPGLLVLREHIAAKAAALYGAQVDPQTEVTVTAGATESLFVAIQACVHPGDEVILLDPAYDSYAPVVRLAGGRPLHLPLAAPDYRIDFDQLAGAIGERTRLVVINSPHNPTASVMEPDDLERLAGLLEGTGVYVLSDEVYEHICFDGRAHASVLAHEALRRRSFVVSSFGKTYHMTGWKVGYCIAPPALTSELRKVHQFVTFAVSTPMQQALAEFMAETSDHLALAGFYQAKRDRFVQALKGSPWQVLPCQGTYFQLLGYAGFDNRPDTDMAQWLTQAIGVACVPISVFNADGRDDRILRFCFAKADATLDEATERLKAAPLVEHPS